GKNYKILSGTLTDPKETENIAQAIYRQKPINTIIITYTKTGKTIWSAFTISPILNNYGHTTHWVFVQRNISDRKQAEDELKESEDKFRKMIEEAGDVVYTTDYKGNFTYINPSGRKISGYSPE